ncbi:beta-D-glucosyl crocetin beta-1 6-glucosyltransferase [Prunus yedoensis var. nudiflora]|nr:beta-D-glucosyl crocetin beta-1 6-glucosyltransferase [Prunus yedoensis var. nudiflora]
MGGGGNENGRLKREEIAKVIRDVVVEENGQGLKRKAMELRDNMKKREDEEIDGVVEQLIQLCMRKE